jgi:4'-phosphopantetheinyl transferase
VAGVAAGVRDGAGKAGARARVAGGGAPPPPAARFSRESLRRSYTAAHGILRDILGRYLQRDPATLRLGHGPRGKPFLIDEDGPGSPGADASASAGPSCIDGPHQPRLNLRFNLSHSGDLALYAVAAGRSVGVDLEQIRGPIEYDQIALRCFTARELAQLRSAPPASQARVFFACWTRIEAYVKARGDGLASVWGRGAASAAGAAAALDDTELSGWIVRDLPAPPGYAAALAAEGARAMLRCWRWRERPVRP